MELCLPRVNVHRWGQERRPTVAGHCPYEQADHCAVDKTLRHIYERLQFRWMDEHHRRKYDYVDHKTNQLLRRNSGVFGKGIGERLKAGENGG